MEDFSQNYLISIQIKHQKWIINKKIRQSKNNKLVLTLLKKYITTNKYNKI
jgi:hypothetical protein